MNIATFILIDLAIGALIIFYLLNTTFEDVKTQEDIDELREMMAFAPVLLIIVSLVFTSLLMPIYVLLDLVTYGFKAEEK